MGRILKIIAGLAAGFAVFFVLAAVALYVFFDPNDFRENISAAVKEHTGRDLVIEGDISLDLFPWLAVEIGETRIGDAPGFGDEPFASFASAKFSVRLLPVVLRQEIIVGAAEINTLHVNLKIDANSVSNWSDLIPEDAGDDTTSEMETGSGVDINRIQISDATLAYSNAESGEVYVLDNMNLNIGRVKDDGSPVPIDGNMHFDLQPTGLSGDMELATVLELDADKGGLVFDRFNVDGTIAGVAADATEMSLTTQRIDVNTESYQVTMQTLVLDLLGMHVTLDVEPFSYEGRITPRATIAVDEFSPRDTMALFDVEPPETADPAALSKLRIDANAYLTTTAMELSDVTIVLDDTTFNGTLSVPRVPAGYYVFDLVGDTINLDGYMEPAAESVESADGAAPATEIPTDLIKPLNARGKLKIKTATLTDIVFDNIEFGLNANAGRLRIFPVSAGLFGGTYSGDVNIDVSGATPTLSVNEKIDGVNLASLAKAMFDRDNVTGTVSGAFQLSGSGADMARIQRNLAGNMSLNLQDGTYEGTDLWYELRRARARLKGEEAPEPTLPARTEFSEVRATGKVSGGVLRNNDLFAALPHMQLTGSGTVDLADATVNYGLTARILERPEFLPDATAEELDEFTEAVIPLKITGPLASPSVKPDVEKLIRQRVEEKIKDKLEDKLKDLFGR